MQLARFLVLAMGLLAIGCAHRTGTAGPPPQPGPARATVAGPRLLFLSGRLTAGAPSRLEVLHLQAVPGELKQNPPEPPGPYVLRLSQLDAAGQELTQLLLPHPLRPALEHVGDDQRTYTRSQVQVPTAEFFARLALRPEATTLRVAETLGASPATITDLSLTSLKP